MPFHILDSLQEESTSVRQITDRSRTAMQIFARESWENL